MKSVDLILSLLSSSEIEEMKKKLTGQQTKAILNLRDEYLKSIENTHSKHSIESVKLAFNQLTKFTNNVDLDKITAKVAEDFFNHTWKRSKYAAMLYLRNLRAAFNKFVRWGYLSVNPFGGISIPKFQKKEGVYIKQDEFYKIVEKETREHLRDIYTVLYYSGLRVSELLNLKYKHHFHMSRVEGKPRVAGK